MTATKPKKNEAQKVTPTIPGHYTTAEAAKRLGLDKSRVDQFCRAGGPLVGKFVMAGIARIFPIAVIEEFAKIERGNGGPKPRGGRPPAPGVRRVNDDGSVAVGGPPKGGKVSTPSANGHARPAGPKKGGKAKPGKAPKVRGKKAAAPKKPTAPKKASPAKKPDAPKKAPAPKKPDAPAPAASEFPKLATVE